MSTIRETAMEALGGRLPRGTDRTKAQTVLDALIAREREMFDCLIEKGVELGATRDQVHDVLVDCGFTAPTHVDRTADADDPVGVLARAVDDLSATVRSLVGFARGKGYRG